MFGNQSAVMLYLLKQFSADGNKEVPPVLPVILTARNSWNDSSILGLSGNFSARWLEYLMIDGIYGKFQCFPELTISHFIQVYFFIKA